MRARPFRSSAAADANRSRSRAAARVDAELLARLGIDEPEVADVRQLLLARVADLDRDHLVPARQLEQRAAPVERPAEVRDDDDERALPRDRARARNASPSDVAPTCVPPPAPRRARSSPISPAVPGSAAALAVRRRRTSRSRAGSRAASRRDRPRARRPPRRPPCAGRPCRTASRATCRARAT